MAVIGVEELVIASASHEFDAAHRWLAVAGVACAYLALAMILVSSSPDERMYFHQKALLRLVGVGLVTILGVAGSGLEPAAFATILATIAVLQVAADIGEHWLTRRGGEASDPEELARTATCSSGANSAMPSRIGWIRSLTASGAMFI
jgi:hypothetical protein